MGHLLDALSRAYDALGFPQASAHDEVVRPVPAAAADHEPAVGAGRVPGADRPGDRRAAGGRDQKLRPHPCRQLRGTLMTDNPVLRAALARAGKEWPVFPCHPGRKVAATPNGYLDATTDRAQIRAWFGARPELNLAVATGAPGPDVLDVANLGPEANGFRGLWRLHKAGLARGATACIDTPSGGMHVYFDGSAQPSGRLPGHYLDFIAKGGYVPPGVPGQRAALRGHGEPPAESGRPEGSR
jgi:Bifunctional DNA primase/polymerase, N-terminal